MVLEIPDTELSQSDGIVTIVINFKNQVLFDMSTFSVGPLTCSPLDATWYMSLPEVFDPDIQIVSIWMQPDQADNLFRYDEETETVYLNDTARYEFLNRKLCPENKETVSLAFDLTSNVKSPSTQWLEIHIEPRNYTAFEGFIIPDEEYTISEQVVELEVEKAKINSLGDVNVRFNKKIMEPLLEILTDRRELQDSESGLFFPKASIEDFLAVELIFEDYFESLNKEILTKTAIAVDEYSITFNVRFAKPSDLTTDINAPDYLKIEFLMPELIVDAENFKYLAESKRIIEVEIVPQYTENEMEQLEAEENVMMAVGGSITLIGLIGNIGINKSIGAIFKLIL